MNRNAPVYLTDHIRQLTSDQRPEEMFGYEDAKQDTMSIARQADEVIDKLKAALDEATEWDWMGSGPPEDVVKQCKEAWHAYNVLRGFTNER